MIYLRYQQLWIIYSGILHTKGIYFSENISKSFKNIKKKTILANEYSLLQKLHILFPFEKMRTCSLFFSRRKNNGNHYLFLCSTFTFVAGYYRCFYNIFCCKVYFDIFCRITTMTNYGCVITQIIGRHICHI